MAEESITSIQDDALDPRIQVELEKLNHASEDINRLELLLDDARSTFRQVLTDSTHQLNIVAKKLGSCIEKARPYYEARLKAAEAQRETQNAALRYERACGQLVAAKEMVNLAEQGFFRKEGQPFDPAWQEMLNHATIKVNDAEKERYESELEHQATAAIFNDAEQTVNELQKDLRRNIAKSRPYFEQKAQFNQRMEEQKKLVGELEEAVVSAKALYAEALGNLEKISDEIHRQRGDLVVEEMGKRGTGVGAESPSPPPHTESSPEEITEQELMEERKKTIGAWLQEAFGKAHIRPDIDITISPRDKTPGDEGESSLAAFPPPTESEFSIALNADVMESLQRAKGMQRLKLPPRKSSSENLLDVEGTEDSESISESLPVLDDSQVENIMKEMWDMEQFMAWLDKSEKWTAAPLPARLTYLEDYIQARETKSTNSSNSIEDHLSLAGKRNPSHSASHMDSLVFKVGDEKWATVVRVDPDGNKQEKKASWAALVSVKPDENNGESSARSGEEQPGVGPSNQTNTGFILRKIWNVEDLERSLSASSLQKPSSNSSDEQYGSSTEAQAPSITRSRNTYLSSHSSHSSSSNSDAPTTKPKRKHSGGKFKGATLSVTESDLPQFCSKGFEVSSSSEPYLGTQDTKQREVVGKAQSWSSNLDETAPHVRKDRGNDSESSNDDDLVICVHNDVSPQGEPATEEAMLPTILSETEVQVQPTPIHNVLQQSTSQPGESTSAQASDGSSQTSQSSETVACQTEPKSKARQSKILQSAETHSLPDLAEEPNQNANAIEWKMCKTTQVKKPLEQCSNSGSSASEWGSKDTPEEESEESDVDKYFSTRL